MPRVNECKSAKFLRRTVFDRVTAKLQDFRHFTFTENLSKPVGVWGCVNGKRCVVRADEKLTAFSGTRIGDWRRKHPKK
jgi:hypothetical protein